MKASFGDRVLGRLRGFAEALKNGEAISQRFTCRRMVLDLNPEPYDREKVKETRKVLGASQTVFAKFLGVSPSTVRAWEQGANIPNDMACRFMDEIRLNPEFWQGRLRQALVAKSSKSRERPVNN